jgi:hypothetical protein
MPPDQINARRIAEFEALAEESYAAMYDSRYPAGCYANLKDYFSQAIRAADHAGLIDEATRLRQRLDHCKQVFRNQFSNF